MKYIRFFMRDKRLDITLDMDQATRIMLSPSQLIMVLDSTGNWTGLTINKAEIKGTDHDWDKEREAFIKNSVKLPEPEYKPVENISRFMPDILKKNRTDVSS